MTDFSPTDAIEAVRRHRGLEPGPPGNVVMPNDREINRGAQASDVEDPGMPVPVPAPNSNVSLATGLGLDRAGVPQEDGISLTRKEGMFEGHVLALTDGEIKRLRAFMAEIAQRQLEDEFKRLKEHRIKGKEAI